MISEMSHLILILHTIIIQKMAQRQKPQLQPIQNGKLTLLGISKTLSKWMNKQDKRDIEQQSHFQITQALEFVFEELKQSFRQVETASAKFDQAIRIYEGLFQSTGNNKHRYLVQNHLKQLLKDSNYQTYKMSKYYYLYFYHVFDCFPYLVFRLLQSRYKQIFMQDKQQVIQLYSMYIRFASNRKNDKLIEQYIQYEVKFQKDSLEKLNILLDSYCNSHAKMIQENSLKQIIKIVHDYSLENTYRNSDWKSREAKMQKFCQTLFKITWPQSLKKFTSRIALGVIRKWQSYQVSSSKKKSINAIINSIQIDHYIQPQLQTAIKQKINDHSSSSQNFGLNCQFVKILLKKFSREKSQKILTKEEYIRMIEQVIKSPFNRQEKIELVEIIRAKKIYNLQTQIEERLFAVIKQRFPTNEKHSPIQREARVDSAKVQNLIFALKSIRFYNFSNFDTIYITFKKYILRNSKLIKQSSLQLKEQILHVCLHYVKTNKFMGLQQERTAFKDIIELIKVQGQLKNKMIVYIVQHLNERFYNQNEIYTIYRENKYDYLLYQDFSTNQILVKIFSIKTICYLAEDANNEHRFFLKNAYNVIYDRLAIPDLLSPQQKKMALKVVREIIRHKGQLFEEQADDFAQLLIKQLHKFIEFHSPEVTSISGLIMKIFQALFKKLPIKMIRYVQSLAHYAICILNFKIIKKQLKKIAIQTFCQIAQNCRYVIVPYFQFPNLYNIIREIMRSDDHFYFYQVQIMRLIGKLGYINKQQFMGLQLLIRQQKQQQDNLKNRDSECYLNHFQKIFSEIGFIKLNREIIKNGTVFKLKHTMPQDGFFAEEDIEKNSIEIQRHVEYVIVTVINNVSLAIQEVKLIKSLKTLYNLIPVIIKPREQDLLHALLLPRLYDIEAKHSNEVLNIILQVLKHHEIGARCVDILAFYMKKVYNHRREDDLLWLFHLITEKYSQLVQRQLINIVIVVKKIIVDSLQRSSQHQQKIKYCFKILMNFGGKLDKVLHLFFIDINKIMSIIIEKNQKSDKIGLQQRLLVQNQILSDYLTFLIFLTQKCTSSQYFLPSIRIFMTTYFNREVSFLKIRHINKKRQHFKSQQQKKFLYKIIDTMILLMVKYGKRCESFINILQKNMRTNNINHAIYNTSQEYFKKHSNLDYLHFAFTKNEYQRLLSNDIIIKRNEQVSSKILHGDGKKNIIKQFQLFCLEQNNSQQQEQLWLDNLSQQLFNNSNEPVLQACSQLAAYDKLFSFDILELPFYFFWKSLYQKINQPQYTYDFSLQIKPCQAKNLYIQTEEVTKLTNKIKSILLRKEVSLRIRQKLLDCIYFIQRCQIPFLIKDKVLSDAAVLVQDQVKALFYLEREYQNDPQVYSQLLIDKYAEIGEKESAIGLFKSIKQKDRANKENIIKLSQKLQPTVEFLQELNLLRERSKSASGSMKKDNIQKYNLLQLQLKRDICDWQSISKFIQKESTKSTASKSKLAHFAIEASINMGQWDTAKNWEEHLDKDKMNEEVKIWLTMLSINQKKYQDAEKYIGEIRDDMNYKIRQMFNLSYQKSMKGVLILQQVTELEEIITFYKSSQLKRWQNKYSETDQSIRKTQLLNLWNDRLQGVKNNLYSMQKILTVRSLLVSKPQDLQNWIKFCELSIKENQKYLATSTYNQLKKLEIKDESKLLQLFVIAQQIEMLEMVSSNEEAFNNIHEYIIQKKMFEDKKYIPLIFEIYSSFSQRVIEEQKFTLQKGNKLLKTLKNFPSSALKDYYQLSHFMGLVNIKLLQITDEEDKRKKTHQRKLTVTFTKEEEQIVRTRTQAIEDKSFTDKKQEYMLGALKYFIKSVTFNQRENKFFLEDCLKILNLISMGNHSAKLIDQLKSNYNNIPREGLIEIIPQLIARLDNQALAFKDLMKDMLIYIGKEHPQSLLFPLLYMKRGYKSETKKALAIEIIEKMSQKYVCEQKPIKSLFNQAQQIVQQLCKISLKLSQKVFLFMRRMIKNLEQNKLNKIMLTNKIIQFCTCILHQHQNTSSPSEFGFIQEHRESIVVLIQHLVFYKQFGEEFYFYEAVRTMKQIKNKINETLSSIKKIYLEEASHKLFNIKKSQVILFGTFSPQGKNVTIDSFKNQIQIILSKQRPKKLVILGSDGKQYKYLLKGKQDLRLDERIMQLFSFINKMFHNPSDKQSYSIQGYSITNISYQIGIISWVQKCDTMGELIQNYRYSNGVRVDNGKIQSKLCRYICPTYPHVQKYHKVEIYHEVIQKVSGMDLKNIFCKRAQTSEKWLKNRSCFIRSLAVMSVVGYLIGLGDRHPFNIMIQRDTAKVVHIDFGDCFEVNKMRKVFPQKVPFRLTRMLVNAMDACRTDGIFKHTCQKIMKILRMNKESILVIVEAFKYDPLFGWSITKGEKDDEVRLQHTEQEQLGGIISQNEEQKKIARLGFQKQESQSTKHILNIIKNKLIGKDNEKSQKGVSESTQVDNLIKEAMSPLNLVQHFQNWCIFW